MARYVVVDGCPCPRKLAPFLRRLKAETGCRYVSLYRGSDAERLLERLGKHSQRWLYEHQGRPEQPNPANPPGRSTHELRNDGSAYPGLPAGARLPWWACGIDLRDKDVENFIAAANRRGWVVRRTYPNSVREHHHLNFRKPPRRHRILAAVGLHRLIGARG